MKILSLSGLSIVGVWIQKQGEGTEDETLVSGFFLGS